MIAAISFITSYLRARYNLRFKSRAALETHQEKSFKRFQKKVLSRSLYYQGFDGKGLGDYPFMNKARMLAHFDEINTRGISGARAMALAIAAEKSRDFSQTMGDVSIGLSSGTSGSRGLFAVSADERARWAGTVLAKILPGGLARRHRIGFFLRANNELYKSVHKRGGVAFCFFDLALPFEGHRETLAAFQPSLLIAPAQVLRLIAEAQTRGEIAIAPEAVYSVAEVLDPVDERIIQSAFSKPVRQIYQCTEGFLACSCAHGRLHLNEEYLIIEKEWVDEKSRRFIPVVTDFSRTTQPVVRYRLDDIVVLDDRPCPCGAVTHVISQIEGRMDDTLLGQGRNGGAVPIFSDYLRHAIITAGNNLRDYHLEQDDWLTLRLAVESDMAEVDHARIASALKQVFSAYGCHEPEIIVAEMPAVSLIRKRRRIVRRFSKPGQAEAAE